jgi:hypothetical protein
MRAHSSQYRSTSQVSIFYGATSDIELISVATTEVICTNTTPFTNVNDARFF